METIKLNDILQLNEQQLENAKIRFMVSSDRISFNPNLDAEDVEKQDKINLVDLVYNRQASISFKEGAIAIGFIRIRDDYWLMTGIVEVKKDNGLGQPATAKYLTKKYNFRVVVKFHKSFQNGIVWAKTIINELEVIEIWNPEKSIGEKAFTGYKNVTIGYKELEKKVELSDEWRTALRSRKGVYLISDKQTGKLYVGSAYGADGILGRWTTYLTSGYNKDEVENGQYPNIELQKLVREKGLSYIQENFQYSIL